MIYDVTIEYCEPNKKYDLTINGAYRGKHYTINECWKQVLEINERDEL